MTVGYAPEGWEQIPLASEEPWVGSAHVDFSTIEALDVDVDSYRYVSTGRIRPIEDGIQKIASDNFMQCSAWVMRNSVTQAETFMHFWPPETEYAFEEWLRSQVPSERNELVAVYGSKSFSTHYERDILRGFWGNLRPRAISIDTGEAYWGAVFDRSAGDLLVLRREPTQSILRYHLFDPQ